MVLDELQSLLCHGNPHPSAGPDGWEKWCVKALSDSALTAILHLVNFEIINSTIPHFLNQATLLTMHKRGLTTQLKNKCGVMLSNFLASLPFVWLSLCLNQYNTAHPLIPQSQIATQCGVQGQDLTSFWPNFTHGLYV